MSDPHRLRSQSLVISSDKTLAARAALRIWVELMKRKRSQPGLALNSSFTMTPLRAGTMHAVNRSEAGTPASICAFHLVLFPVEEIQKWNNATGNF